MNKKILIISILILILFGVGYWLFNNVSFVDDNMLNNPDSLINNQSNVASSDIMGDISVYLIDTETNTLKKETRTVSLKALNSSPYLTILQELQKTNTNLKCPIPSNTKLNSYSIQDSVLIIDLSSEFISQDISNNLDTLIIQSIVKTLSNLKEISEIQITIDGNSSKELGTYSLSKSFNISEFD